jgi:indolepyruvate ferredoxin oxidoreductase
VSVNGPRIDATYELEDRYRLEEGRVYLTGVQALVRLPLLQRQRDAAAGLDTAGFISGYRGSPLGTYDMALWQARPFLEEHRIRFEPGVNEDLAATAVWGSQQANLYDGARHDGVFGIWYGKGPGVDRSCDALKHANYAGTAPHGGVLALCGDDPSARSSSIAHQSEHALIHCGIPILNPANVQDYLDFGLYGWALSRYSGCWVAMKCLTDTVDSAASVRVGPDRVRIRIPEDHELPPGGLSIGWQNYPLQVEHRLYQQRHPAVHAFVRANGLDRVVLDSPQRRLGIVTTGKAYLDVRQALEELGIDEARAAALGLSVYKVALSWPLEPEGARAFAAGLEDVLVVEEKRPILEDQLARLLYNLPERPRLLGKLDENGTPLVSSEGELEPNAVVAVLRRWLERRAPGFAPPQERTPLRVAGARGPAGLMRLPSFCSGCPHNTSTVLPDDSIALGGIGCHGMAVFLPERRTLAVTQMGGEGANWIGAAPFTDTPHIFQNLGDGTYFHSGLLAIRAAVTAGVNVTYKVLANGAIAMTGGQPIEGEALEGEVSVPDIVRQLASEGVPRIAVVSDDPRKYPRGTRFPEGVTFHHRDDLDRVQRELREVSGVTAIVYDQTCAAEARRLRKRGEFPDPDTRIVIHQDVCEGCGDCSVQSNCISIEPVETGLGRKRRINQSSCNKDYSCVKGYCPSFVSVIGGALRKAESGGADTDADSALAGLPEPALPALERPFNVLVAGIGGSGVITVGALLGMAAHLEGKGCSVLDVTGLAQKNGPVTSYVRLAESPEQLHATRIAAGGADLVLGSDIVVASGMDALSKMAPGRTTAVVNSHVAPTSDFATNPDLDLSSKTMEDAIRTAAGDGARFVSATSLATALLGDAIATNLFLVGYAWQLGRIPVSRAALERAIELNGRALEMNRRAFQWGRLAAHDPGAVQRIAKPLLRKGDEAPAPETLAALVAHRSQHLTAYQNAAYAARYRALVERVIDAERALGDGRDDLARAVASAYAKVLAYKDEYEVARLYTDGSLERQLEREFEGDYQLRLHLSAQFLPGALARRDPDTGRARKLTLPAPLMFAVFRVIRAFRFLRGTPFDFAGWTEHRRGERRLIADYERRVEELIAGLSAGNRDVATEIARLPEQVRGFDTVKDENLRNVREKEAELLRAFQLSTSA